MMTHADVRSVVCERSTPATAYVCLKSFISKCSPDILLTVEAESQAREEFCFMQQYFVGNSAFLESDPSAIAISSSINLTETDTPKFGLALRSSFHIEER